jgi:hypothetical protein
MARIVQQGVITTSGVSFENEPIVRSDGSGEIMQWQPSDGGADGIYIVEGGSAGDPLRLGIGIAAPTEALDVSGNVLVNGGGYVKIAPANTTAELRLYRDDATINTSGIAIGDINFGGADANNDNAARLRVKSAGAWTSTSSPTAFEFQTCPSGSESPQTRLTINSTGQITTTTTSADAMFVDSSHATRTSIYIRNSNATTNNTAELSQPTRLRALK